MSGYPLKLSDTTAEKVLKLATEDGVPINTYIERLLLDLVDTDPQVTPLETLWEIGFRNIYTIYTRLQNDNEVEAEEAMNYIVVKMRDWKNNWLNRLEKPQNQK